MNEPPPSWVAIPGLRIEDPTTQGIAENYIVLTWYPFWASISPEERAAYLDRWQTSAEWREAIIERYETEYDEAGMPPCAYGAGADASSQLSLSPPSRPRSGKEILRRSSFSAWRWPAWGRHCSISYRTKETGP